MQFIGALVLILLSWLVIVPVEASAQTASAALNGTVTDPSGAVVPQAKVVLANTATGVTQTAQTNSVGRYVLLNIPPGNYTLEVSKTGFVTARMAPFTLAVNQTTSFDFTLKLGTTTQAVQVSGVATHLETSTAGLGSVVGSTEVNNLPLNGRNFTQLLTLSAGVSPINTGQNGGGWLANPVGSFTFPSVNGAPNRSNMFLVDGVVNYGSFTSTYGTPPILNDIQEFKVQSQNDQAQFGQALGGIVNVVTKSGTNQFHGQAWEFLRNNALDARNFFAPDVTPLKQNQFGGSIGGPVILPGYNGRNRTFFYTAYEGFRNHTSSLGLYRVPTTAELGGNLSDISEQIYNPFSTRPDPNLPGGYIRDPFMCDAAGNPLPVNASGMQAAGTPCNMIPSTMLDPGMELFAKKLYPSPINTGVPGFNGRDTTPGIVSQDEATIRFDEALGSKDRLFGRYTGLAQSVSGSGGFVGLGEFTWHHSYNVAAGWNHTFGSNSVLQLEFGRTTVQTNDAGRFNNAPANFWQQVGFAPNFTSNMLGGRSVLPAISIDGFLGGGEILDWMQSSNIYEFKGDYSRIIGHHILKMGASFATNNVVYNTIDIEEGFSSFQTSDLVNGGGGSALASFLLGVPDSTWRGNQSLTTHHAWVDGFYFQDQWQPMRKLTVNLGVRYDVSLWGRMGSAAEHNTYGGNWDLNTGTYVLMRSAPPCSATQYAPCIPGGTLPAHVVVSSRFDQLLYNDYGNVSPRLGLAYRLGPRTVLRGSYSRFFDNWPAINQAITNSETFWPDMGGVGAGDLNATYPNRTAEDPLNLGSGFLYPPPTPYNLGTAFFDPHLKNARLDNWHAGFQRQLGANTVLTANYVGSHGSRIPIFIPWNTATTPGPGDVNARRLFPYLTVTQPYLWSWGRSSYNGLQLSVNKQAKNLTYSLAYTWSKTMDIGSDGYYSGRSVENPYNLDNNKSVAGYDLTNVLAASWNYPIPFGKDRWATSNRALNYGLGGWELNGILTLSSGQPYTVHVPGDVANIGTGGNRPNLVGDPNLSSPTPEQWFNTSAFVFPDRYTFGSLGRNTMRSDWRRNLDLSIFREFPITESKRFEFRFEAFNVTNTPVFGIPDTTKTDPSFGQVTYTGNTERQLQFALKFYF